MSNKIKKIITMLLMALFGVFGLIYSHDIGQKNPETIFLTSSGLKDYLSFKNKIQEKQTLAIKKSIIQNNLETRKSFYAEVKKLEKYCLIDDDCEIITQEKFSRSKLAQLEDENFIAAIIMDNTDEGPKKILKYMHQSEYWNDGSTTYAGIPYTNYLLDKYSLSIQEKLFPMMFILGLIIAFVFIKRFYDSLIAYLPCLFSAGFSLSYLKYFHEDMNMVTAIIPLIVFTVILSLSFHLYFTLVELKSLKQALKMKWAPIFLMMFTTYIGFLSLSWSEIKVIRDFGLISSHLVLVCTTYTFFWYFLWEKFIEAKNQKLSDIEKEVIPSAIFKKTLPYFAIVLLAILSFAGIYYVRNKLEVITDATRYFPPTEKIREKMVEVTQTVSAMPIMEIVLELSEDFGPLHLSQIQQLENTLSQLKLSQKYQLMSNISLIKSANREYSGAYQLPTHFEGILLLRGQLPSALQDSYPVDKNYRITLLSSPLNVTEYLKDLELVKNAIKSSQFKYSINGIHHQLMFSQNAMIDVLFSSFLSSIVVIFLFSAFFLKSWRLNLIFIFVTFLPVALTFGLLHFFHYSINIATVMTFSIALGLVGDSSFHIIYAMKNPFKDFQEYSRGVLAPVVGSGLLLSTCFGIFIFNDFIPIKQFGSILAVIIFFGTLVDLFVLPTLLYRSHRHFEVYRLNQQNN